MSINFIVFSRKTCPPCARLEPFVDTRIADGFDIKKMKVDDDPEAAKLAQDLRVRAVPSVYALSPGIPVVIKIDDYRFLLTKEQTEEMINSLVIKFKDYEKTADTPEPDGDDPVAEGTDN